MERLTDGPGAPGRGRGGEGQGQVVHHRAGRPGTERRRPQAGTVGAQQTTSARTHARTETETNGRTGPNMGHVAVPAMWPDVTVEYP